MNIQELQIRNPWWLQNGFIPEESKWFKRYLFETIIENIKEPMAISLIGLRRVGKSTIIKQVIADLLSNGEKPENIFYFLFDYSSQPKTSEYLDDVISTYLTEIKKVQTSLLNERLYFFLDEIQYIENWQAVVKKYYDLSGKKIKFIVTGSQSVFIKGKNKESLAGRIIDYYLPPLQFDEFIKLKRAEVEPPNKFDLFLTPENFARLSAYNLTNSAKLLSLANEYLIYGQFPECLQIQKSEFREEYIRESVLGKVLGDIITLFNIEKTEEFKLAAYHLINNAGSIFELSNIGKEIGISKITMSSYYDYLCEGHIVETFYKYHKGISKRGRTLRKCYAHSVNFICTLNNYNVEHIEIVPEAFGKIIENIVYSSVKHLTGNAWFWRKGEKEIDFILNKNKKFLPIEVKFSKRNVNPKDIGALIDYVNEKKLSFGIVITKNELDKKTIAGAQIFFIPYYLVI